MKGEIAIKEKGTDMVSSYLFYFLAAGILSLTMPAGCRERNKEISNSGFQNLSGIAWSGIQFAAVGQSGTILISPDGIAWTSRASSTAYHLANIIWTGTRFAAVGQLGVILTSPDSVTWTVRKSGTTYNLSGITWSGTQFAAVGQSGTILTSLDGITWTIRTSGTTNWLWNIAWLGTQFIAIGNSGTILTSPDGITWASRTSGTNEALYGIVWSGKQFAVVGSFGKILTSPDGISWTARTTGTMTELKGIVWSGTQFTVVGEYGTKFTSPDGIAWTSRTSGTNWLNNIIWSGSQFVAVGWRYDDSGSGTTFGTIFTSPDGIAWTSRASLQPVTAPGNIISPLGTQNSAQRPSQQLTKCSLSALSESNIDCWNNLFGEFLYFKGIVSFEIADLSGTNDVGVIFTAVGHAVHIPQGTIILPEGITYDDVQRSNKFEYLVNRIERDTENKVFNGLIMQNPLSGKMELKAFGTAALYELDGNCDGLTEANLSSLVKGPGVKVFCCAIPCDALPQFSVYRISPSKPPLIAYNFAEGGDSSPIYDSLFIFRDKRLKSLVSASHSKDDHSLIKYEKGKIIEQFALHTPFEPDPPGFGHWYFYSFIVRAVYTLDQDKLKVIEETIEEPTSIDTNNEGGNGWSVSNQKKKIGEMLQKQKSFTQGKNKWLGEPIAYVQHACSKCTNIRKVFQKNGVAIVWADMIESGNSRHVSYYLYKPLYEYNGIKDMSIWQEAESNETYLSNLQGHPRHRENGKAKFENE